MPLIVLCALVQLVSCRDGNGAANTAAQGVETATAAAPVVLEFRGPTMGTAYSVKCWSSAPNELTGAQVQQRVDDLLADVNRQMSTYDPESELSRFNRAAADEWFAVSPPTASVVAASIELHERTEGALDVTISPVLRLWHFGADAKGGPGQVDAPTAAQLAAAQAATGVGKLHVQTEPPALRKDVAELQVDLSSIAKGYAADAVSELLAELGLDNSMVEIGGEIRARGRRPGGEPWRIGVESPDPRKRTLAATVPLTDMAMATSGDYRNYRRADGELVTHIIDPRTGRALPFRGMSVSVFRPTCMEADGVATALVVLGDDRAYDWCVEHEVAALFQVIEADGGVASRATPRYRQLASATD